MDKDCPQALCGVYRTLCCKHITFLLQSQDVTVEVVTDKTDVVNTWASFFQEPGYRAGPFFGVDKFYLGAGYREKGCSGLLSLDSLGAQEVQPKVFHEPFNPCIKVRNCNRYMVESCNHGLALKFQTAKGNCSGVESLDARFRR